MGAIGLLTLAGAVIYSLLVITLWGASGARMRWLLGLVATIAFALTLRGSAEVFGWPQTSVTSVIAIGAVDLVGLGLLVALRRHEP